MIIILNKLPKIPKLPFILPFYYVLHNISPIIPHSYLSLQIIVPLNFNTTMAILTSALLSEPSPLPKAEL